MSAVMGDNIDIVQKLLSAKADTDKADKGSMTALMFAVTHGNPGIIQKLLDAKADTDKADEDGMTALIFAVKHRNLDIIQKLLDAKADTDKADKDGMTALMFTVGHGPDIIRSRRVGSISRQDASQTETSQMKAAEIAKMLLDAKANADAKNHKNFAALYFAAESGNIYMAKVLLNGGANPDIKDNKGNTPLHIAAEKVNDGMVKTLLFGGANSMPKNNIGITPLDIALSNKSPHVERLIVMNKSSGKQSPDDVMANIRRMMSENSSPSPVGKCGNKDSFASEHDAKEKADIIHRKRGKNLRPYQCNHCNKWHLTSQPQR
ncbi:MAG: ankyrin repeat domain-containing protein, partial [Gammaproteobacteria bacterium]